MTDATSLRGIQEWMQNALINPQEVRHNEIAAHLVPSNRLAAADRLAIYQRSYISRLRVCLAEQFPASRHALGAELFDRFARVYLAQSPSDSYTLYELGRRFPAFLNDTRPDKDKPEDEQETWINFMIDLASYERTLFVLFDAPGHEGNPWPTIETRDEDLILQPCFALRAYRFPVANYYHCVTDQSEPDLPPMNESYVVMVRHDYMTSSFPITRLHYDFLTLLQDGQTVDQALQSLADQLDIPAPTIRDAWVREIRDQWISNHFFVERH